MIGVQCYDGDGIPSRFLNPDDERLKLVRRILASSAWAMMKDRYAGKLRASELCSSLHRELQVVSKDGFAHGTLTRDLREMGRAFHRAAKLAAPSSDALTAESMSDRMRRLAFLLEGS